MWQFHPYSLLLFLSFSLNLILGLFIFRSFRLNIAKYLLLLVAGSLLWTGSYALDFIFIHNGWHKLFISVLYIGVAIASAAIVLVAIELTQNTRYLTGKFWLLLSVQPVFMFLVVFLDPIYNTLIADTYLTSISNRLQWVQVINPLAIIITFGISVFWAIFITYIVTKAIIESKTSDRYRYILFFAACALIWVTSTLHYLGFRPLPGLNITSVMFTFQVLLIFVAIGYYRMYELVPLVRSEIVDELDEAVVILDIYNRVVDWNSSAEQLFLKDRKLPLFTTHTQYFSGFPEIIRKLEILSDKRILTKWIWEFNERSYEVAAKQVKDSHRKKMGLVLVYRDITEQKNLEKQMADMNRNLLASNGTKDRFLSIISHDLRGPLAGIKMLLKILNEDVKKNDEKIAPMTQALVDATESVFSLLENLLEWAKMQRGQEEFRPQFYRLESLVYECIELFELNAFSKSIVFDLEIPSHAMVFCDDRMLFTVLRNLISNAIKFSHKESQITIKAEETESFWRLSVIDSGIGMDKETMNRLFQVGEVITSIGTQGETGNGVGLLLSQEFTRMNGGTIHAESDGKTGSSFIVTIPKKPSLEGSKV
ncbi:histidine kinase N-terminal 7TM domain-containing protein [Leptospira sp. 96542]|nr:histidine kinase N-terminal 7TM domain-containing protein [Leptospira sp. 96542]